MKLLEAKIKLGSQICAKVLFLYGEGMGKNWQSGCGHRFKEVEWNHI
jgi:hypothetical protein